MDLVVADAELEGMEREIADALEALVGAGERYVALLEKLGAMGYVSEAVGAALAEHGAAVSAALEKLSDASDPLERGVSALIREIDTIDKL